MFRDNMFNDVIEYVTYDAHPFMEALTLSTRVPVNDNAANENETPSETVSRPDVAA